MNIRQLLTSFVIVVALGALLAVIAFLVFYAGIAKCGLFTDTCDGNGEAYFLLFAAIGLTIYGFLTKKFISVLKKRNLVPSSNFTIGYALVGIVVLVVGAYGFKAYYRLNYIIKDYQYDQNIIKNIDKFEIENATYDVSEHDSSESDLNYYITIRVNRDLSSDTLMSSLDKPKDEFIKYACPIDSDHLYWTKLYTDSEMKNLAPATLSPGLYYFKYSYSLNYVECETKDFSNIDFSKHKFTKVNKIDKNFVEYLVDNF